MAKVSVFFSRRIKFQEFSEQKLIICVPFMNIKFHMLITNLNFKEIQVTSQNYYELHSINHLEKLKQTQKTEKCLFVSTSAQVFQFPRVPSSVARKEIYFLRLIGEHKFIINRCGSETFFL